MELACQVVQRCDAAAVCETLDGAWEMAIEPMETMEDGIGTYAVYWRGKTLLAGGESHVGPFFWKESMVIPYTLALTGEETGLMIHHNFNRDRQAPEMKLDFLKCDVVF